MQAEETDALPVRQANVCHVEVTPAEVDAGAEMQLRASLACEPARDLRGRTLLIRDAAGAVVASPALTEYEDGINETAEFAMAAPGATGEHRWTVALAPDPDAEDGAEDCAGSFAVTVVPHATSLLVWGVPSAITVGEAFTFRIGLKCSSECAHSGAEVTVHDADGTEVARASISAEVWPGTSALHVAEVTLEAPAAAGRHRWEARIPSAEEGLAHSGARAGFGVCFVERPDCEVTIEARDAETGAAIPGAKVVMHPFRVLADREGKAQLEVPRGPYRIYVSAPRYAAITCDVEVTEDISTLAELLAEPPEDLARGYT